MNDSRDLALYTREQIQAQLTFNAYLLALFATVLAIVSVFSIPFPYVRQYWIQEIWGISGLINASLFFGLSRSIEKFALPAALGALGVILNEQILAWTGFLFLLTHGPLAKVPVLFMMASVIVSFFLLMVIGDSIRQIWNFRKRFKHDAQDTVTDKPGYQHLFFSFAGYVAAFGIIFFASHQSPFLHYALLKIIGGFTAAGGFAGAGIEIRTYLERNQTGFHCTLKALSHFLMVMGILWVIYRTIPVSDIVIVPV